MPRLTRSVSPVLDGTAVQINAADKATAVRIESGEYPTPFWVQVVGGITVRVDSLPWQGVLPPAAP